MPSTFAITGVTARTSAAGTTFTAGNTLDLVLATDLTVDSVTLAGGVAPTLALSNGATASYTGFDAAGLHFAYTVAAGQDATGLALTGLDLHGATVAHAGTSGFAAKTDYATGVNPYSVTSADVNGDGKVDLLSANYGSNTVSVLLGKGDGTFGAKRDYAAISKPYSITAADVNGDGKPDLTAVSYGNDSFLVSLGKGDGTFRHDLPYGATGRAPTSVTSADVNGDGKADLITANESSDTVSVLLGYGDGTFQAKQDYATGFRPRSVTSADVNGDGKADLVAANNFGDTVSVLLGNGDGTFQAKRDYATDFAPRSVTSADVNGDGKADLVTANDLGTVSVLLGKGDGTFQAKRDYATDRAPRSVVTADVNGDGKPDIVTSNEGVDTVSVLLGNGDGTFQAKQDYATGFFPRSVTSADVNGDGKVDLITSNVGDDTVSVLLNNGTLASQLDASSLFGATSTTTGLSIATGIAVAISVAGATNLAGGHVVSGTIDPAAVGAPVTLYDGTQALGTATSDADGHFALAFTNIDGGTSRVYHLTASVKDSAGHTGISPVFDYALDFTPNQGLFGSVTHDAGSIGGQIYALYDGLLGRAPDTLGLSFWTDAVAHGTSLHDVAAAMLASGEFAAGHGGAAFTAGSDHAFVQHLYTVGLGRAADADGAASWDGALAAGTSRVDVALSLALSPENVAQIAPALGTGLFVPDATAASVARLYDAAFGREPDAAGLASWTAAARAGMPLDTIMSGFLASTEGVAHHPAGESDTAFVHSLYAGALGRTADAGGLAYYESLLAHGTSRATVATTIAESPEAQTHLVGHVEAGWHLA